MALFLALFLALELAVGAAGDGAPDRLLRLIIGSYVDVDDLRLHCFLAEGVWGGRRVNKRLGQTGGWIERFHDDLVFIPSAWTSKGLKGLLTSLKMKLRGDAIPRADSLLSPTTL